MNRNDKSRQGTTTDSVRQREISSSPASLTAAHEQPEAPVAPSPGNQTMDADAVHELTQMAKAMSEGDFYRDLSQKVTGELGRLAHYINKTRQSLQCLDDSTVEATAKIPEASATLSSITEATEEATHKILSTTEKLLQDQGAASAILSRLNQESPSSGDWHAQIQELSRINEQSQADLIEILTNLSFQDLTGQKIQKIVHLVQDIERRILSLIVSFGIKMEERSPRNPGEMKTEIMSRLEGQSQAAGLSQDLVDDILAQFNGPEGDELQ